MIYRIPKNISWQAVDDLLWIIDEKTQELYVSCNEVSIIIWKRLFYGEDDEKIKAFLYNVYQAQEINSDVQEFINRLVSKGMLEYDKSICNNVN